LRSVVTSDTRRAVCRGSMIIARDWAVTRSAANARSPARYTINRAVGRDISAKGSVVCVMAFLALTFANCRRTESPQQRYEQAAAALLQGNPQEARRVVNLLPTADGSWKRKFRLLDAEITLAEGRAEQALALLESPFAESELEARRLMLRGDGLVKLDRYDEARRALDEAAARAAALHSSRLAVEVDLLKGRLLTIRNDVKEAGLILDSALAQAGQLRDPYLQAVASNSLAINALRVFRYDEAVTFATQALHFAEQAGAERVRASALANLGTANAYLGDFEKAQAYSEEAVAIREKMGDQSGLQSILGSLGNVYMLEGDARKAIPYYRRALAEARQLHAGSYASVWAANLAEALVEAGDWDAAAQLSVQQDGAQDEQTRLGARQTRAEIAAGRKQFAEAERLLTEIIHSAPSNPAQLWEAHARLGDLYGEIGQRQKAGEHFEKAISLMEKTRSEVFQAEHRATYLSRWIRFYQNYVDLLMEGGDSGKAFQVSELSRARILAERMGGGPSQVGPPPLSAYQEAARRMGTLFLAYWIAPRRSFLWVITPREVRAFTLPGEKEIAGLVDSHQQSLDNLRDPLTSDESPGSRLYSMLLGQASSLFPEGCKVIVVPDGPLHNLNFETLPVPGKSRHYWVEDVTLSVAPSLGFGLLRPSVQSKVPASLLLIGDPEPAGPDYPKLAYASRELAEIERAFPSVTKTVLTGVRANPSSYRESRPEQFSLIHFAAHGLANRASPLDSAVILSPKSGAFMLYARDIAEQPLHAQLVTIASCRSAGAKSYPGEGLLGLAWAFLRAGANEVIAGLWDANDKSTAEIMASLYAGLAAGKPSADALREAKLAMVRRSDRYHQPYYWGAFQDYTGAHSSR
jgi:CHAT domain-containing protein